VKHSESISIGTDDIELKEEHLNINKENVASAAYKKLYKSPVKIATIATTTPDPKLNKIKHLSKKSSKRLTFETPGQRIMRLAAIKEEPHGENSDEESPIKIEENSEEDQPPTIQTQPFSFFGCGGTNWVNIHSFGSPKDSSSSSSTTAPPSKTYTTDKIVDIPNTTNKQDICFNCYNKLSCFQYHTHKFITDRAFCSIECMDSSCKPLLGTCEICYSLFEKFKGIISCGVWVCSSHCGKIYERRDGPGLYSNPEAENVIKVCEKGLRDREAERNWARSGG
jgi:hypothetical protein